MKKLISLQNILYILSGVIAIAVAYGSITTQLSAHDVAIKTLAPVPVQLAILSEQLTSIKEDTNRIRQDVKDLRSATSRTAK